MKILPTVLLMLLSLSILAQNRSKIDSLKKELGRSASDTSKANTLIVLGNLYIDNLDSASSAISFLKSIQISEKADFKKGVIKGYNEFGRLQELTQWPDKALHYYNKAVLYGKKHDLKEGLALAYRNLYFIASHKSEYRKAILYADSALNLFRLLKKQEKVADQYNNIGLMHFKMGDHKAALMFYNKAIGIYNTLGEAAEVRKANTLSNIGLIYEALKSRDQALAYYLKSKAISEKHKNLDKLIEVNMNIGNVYWSQGKYNEAVKIYKSNLEASRKSTNVLSFGIASANLANVYTDMKRFADAEKYYAQAISEYKKLGYKEGLWQTYLNYTRVLAEKKDYVTAEANLWKTLSIIREIGQNDQRYLVYYSLAEVKKRQKNYDEAFRFQDSAFMLKDEVLNKSTNEKVASLQMQYETEQKEVELTKNKLLAAQQKMALQKRNNLLMLSFITLSLLVLTTFYVIKSAREKRRRIVEENQLKLQLANSEAQSKLQGEKLRISRELHDNVGSQLTFIQSSIQSLKGSVVAGAEEKLNETSKIASETIRELRQTVWLINHQEITVEEFVIKLRDYIRPYHSIHPNISVETGVVMNCVLDSAKASNLFRVIQEAINNCLKYSRFSELIIRLEVSEEGRLQLSIADDGIGFDSSISSTGFGLRNMNARAQELNGSLIVQSAEGKGTSLTLNIPV